MADIWLRSTDGNDGNAGTAKEAPKATAAAALTAAGAGGRVFVSDLHNESTAAAVTLASPGTASSPTQILCVPDWGASTGSSPETSVTTGASVATGSGAANSLSFSGFAFSDGVSYSAGVGSTSSTSEIRFTSSDPWAWVIKNGLLEVASSSSSADIEFGTTTGEDDQLLTLINTPLKFGNAAQQVFVRCSVVWRDTPSSAVQGTVPDSLIVFVSGSSGADITVTNVDLSALASGDALVDVSVSARGYAKFKNCKLGSSVAVATGSIAGPGGADVELVNCDSGDTNYRYARHDYFGVVTSETTIVRTGGASDGTTTISRKMVSSANSKFYSPLESDPIVFWNETTGSAITVTIPIVTDNVTLTDAEAWIEVEYLGTSGFPLATFASDRAADILATPANQTTDGSSTWTTTGLGTPVKQSLAVTFTPQEKGPVKIRVMLAKASATLYFDPLAQVS